MLNTNLVRKNEVKEIFFFKPKLFFFYLFSTIEGCLSFLVFHTLLFLSLPVVVTIMVVKSCLPCLRRLPTTKVELLCHYYVTRSTPSVSLSLEFSLSLSHTLILVVMREREGAQSSRLGAQSSQETHLHDLTFLVQLINLPSQLFSFIHFFCFVLFLFKEDNRLSSSLPPF